jgi:hypothetical protein
MPHSINPALIGKAGEMLVAAELMRRGVEVAYPASDVGVDLLAYRLQQGNGAAKNFIPIQVKSASKINYAFFRYWFEKAPGIILVHVWNLAQTDVAQHPRFYIFGSVSDVEDAIRPHVETKSWHINGKWSEPVIGSEAMERLKAHQNRWDRIITKVDR